MVTKPTILNCPLRSYQLIGLNWLALLYEQKMCGILADESMFLYSCRFILMYLKWVSERQFKQSV